MEVKDRHFPELAEARILLVEDDEVMAEVISSMIKDEVSLLSVAHNCNDALNALDKEGHNIAIVDVYLPDNNGFYLVKRLRKEKPMLSLLMITGFAKEEMAQKMEEVGVQSLLTKPFTQTQLKFSICRELARRRNEGRERAAMLYVEDDASSELTGNSVYIRQLRKQIDDLGRTTIPVLITGPTGTGKEIIARAVHARSDRASKPMITVNSAAIPEHLEESEFFGYARGAFTGATHQKDGIFTCADGSTLFLDEVGELSLRMQAKLLRVLDGHEFYRVGDTTPQRSDFRLISATNRPLPDMIKAGLFREDLYFRLRAAVITTQPLVRHKEDIPALINRFLSGMRQETERDFHLSVDALEIIMHYRWPGNIRELKNTIETLCRTKRESDLISREEVLWLLSETSKAESEKVVPFSKAKLDFEREYYRDLLIKFSGNISLASRAAGIERAYFSKRVKALGLAKEKYAKGGLPAQKTTSLLTP